MPVNWDIVYVIYIHLHVKAYPGLLPWYNIYIVFQIVNVDISLLFLTIFIRYKADIDKLLMRYTHAPCQFYL